MARGRGELGMDTPSKQSLQYPHVLCGWLPRCKWRFEVLTAGRVQSCPRLSSGPAACIFHLPKPLHGWRELVGEVGIIVVGVLIALAAEQIVETLHWRNQTRETERALRTEIQESVNSVAERQALEFALDKAT